MYIIKFFTKSIQIIKKKNIAYFHNQWKYSIFVKVVLKGKKLKCFQRFYFVP